MNRSDIRVKALALFRRGDEILVHEVLEKDVTQRLLGYRLLGGHVEFGERAEETLKREIKEELGTEIRNVRFKGVSENIFVWAGKPSHEVIFVFEAEFIDQDFYKRDTMQATKDDGSKFNVLWLDPHKPRESLGLFPDGLLDMLKRLDFPASLV